LSRDPSQLCSRRKKWLHFWSHRLQRGNWRDKHC
jgi:hypothetical protein